MLYTAWSAMDRIIGSPIRIISRFTGISFILLFSVIFLNSSFFLRKKSVLLPESWTYAECCTLKKQKNKTSRTKTGFTQLCYSFTL